MPHRCGICCLGPLTFHRQAVGEKVHLRQGGLLAERANGTFKNGLVFSSRPLRIKEKIRLRVEKTALNWHGALRVGFTNVPPTKRPLPLPIMAIPLLSDKEGHWATPVDESICQTGSVLEFWVSHRGRMYVRSNFGCKLKLQEGLDLSRPLWAMIDIYGQTSSIFLLGSKKSEWISTRRSCPVLEYPTSLNAVNIYSLSPVASGGFETFVSGLDTNNSAGKKAPLNLSALVATTTTEEEAVKKN
ncbi:E3 ubiquitin-protein ligase NEURL3 [Aulostomus maculatus]